MKKLMLILVSILMLGITSCSKDDDAASNVKQDWTITITTTISVVPAMDGYPLTQTITVDETNLTESEVKTIADKYKSTITQSMAGYSYTTTMSATYTVKK
ncbi:hypothetical protein [Parabacteroides sp. FAFU027]|uniref:hypothetical protein n=1 Tax=Parabacteroides sp. FAFU027 TaxID=2922715 RepID=UPI001FAFD458|nr:hypothetical protein [Parabacteroides sp. FAFU027]